MSKLKERIKQAAKTHVPGAVDLIQTLRLRRQLGEVMRACAGWKTLPELVAAHARSGAFPASQVESEITRLLGILNETKAARVCEFGAALGGTLWLFSQASEPDARIVSLDYGFTNAQLNVLPLFASERRSISCLQGDSHAPASRDAFSQAFGGQPIDFLFIDGDHAYEAIVDDFARYSPLVREGGVIALHDINPDRLTRVGQLGGSSGGVPRFWDELRAARPDLAYEEIIADRGQDGLGIGVIRWKGAR